VRHTGGGVRILLVNKFAHVTGGADQHCLDLAAALTDAGHDVRMLSTADPANGWRSGAFVPVSTSAGTRDQTRLLDAAPVFFKALWHRGAAAAMRRLAAEFRPDVVHAHKLYPQISVAPVVEAARLGLPVVQTLHDFEMVSANHLDPRARALDLTETQLRYRALNTATFPIRRRVQLPRVGRFIAVSEVAAASHRPHGIDPVVIRNFAPEPPDAVPGWAERAGALYLGRLTEGKGVRDVVALARAAPDVPVDIVGFGELGEELAAAAAELPNLTYHGWVPREETVRRLLGARVVLMPSLAPEGGPLVALQAMALGAPVVAYDAGGLGEYVRRGGGDVIERGVEPLAGAVRRILSDEGVWATMSEHGRRAVYAEHTPGQYVARLERVYAAVA